MYQTVDKNILDLSLTFKKLKDAAVQRSVRLMVYPSFDKAP